MSVPYETITCDGCSYRQNTLITAGKFVWKSGGQEFWFDRELAVCHTCRAVVAMEKFPDEERLQKLERQHRELEERKRLIAKRQSNFLHGLLGRFGEKIEEYQLREDGYSVLQEVRALQRDPVCLTCGNTSVTPIIRTAGGSNDTSVRSLGVVHPGCGGQLKIQGSGNNRIAPAEVTRIYDINGQKIGERQGWV